MDFFVLRTRGVLLRQGFGGSPIGENRYNAGLLPAMAYAPIAQWIEHWSSEPVMGVRIPLGAKALAGGSEPLLGVRIPPGAICMVEKIYSFYEKDCYLLKKFHFLKWNFFAVILGLRKYGRARLYS